VKLPDPPLGPPTDMREFLASVVEMHRDASGRNVSLTASAGAWTTLLRYIVDCERIIESFPIVGVPGRMDAPKRKGKGKTT